MNLNAGAAVCTNLFSCHYFFVHRPARKQQFWSRTVHSTSSSCPSEFGSIFSQISCHSSQTAGHLCPWYPTNLIQPQKSAKVHENVPVYPAECLHPPNLTNYWHRHLRPHLQLKILFKWELHSLRRRIGGRKHRLHRIPSIQHALFCTAPVQPLVPLLKFHFLPGPRLFHSKDADTLDVNSRKTHETFSVNNWNMCKATNCTL